MLKIFTIEIRLVVEKHASYYFIEVLTFAFIGYYFIEKNIQYVKF